MLNVQISLINGETFVTPSSYRHVTDFLDFFHRNPWPVSLTVVGKSASHMFDSEDFYTLAVRGSHVVSVKAL